MANARSRAMGRSSRTEVDETAGTAAFDRGAGAWEEYASTPLGRLRTELTLHNLRLHLPSLGAPEGLHVLDAGGGTGSYALPLAEDGHSVCILDLSPEMLAVTRRKTADLGETAGGRLTSVCGSVEDVPKLFPSGGFDVVLCHTILKYTKDPSETLKGIAGTLRPGGLISILFVTPVADTLRWTLTRRDLKAGLRSLREQVPSTDCFGAARRTFSPDWMRGRMKEAGLDVEAEYGIRVFADHLPAEALQDSETLVALWDLEVAASTIDPFRHMGRYMLTIGKKRG